MVIYPGKVSKAPCFRIGNIGIKFVFSSFFSWVDLAFNKILHKQIMN